MKNIASIIISLLSLVALAGCISTANSRCDGSCAHSTAAHTDIIPQPLEVTKLDGRFTIDHSTTIICDKEVANIAAYLKEYIPLSQSVTKCDNSIRLHLDSQLAEEAYTLTIDKQGVEIRGGGYGGVFNGVQSLLQLLPQCIYSKSRHLPLTVGYIAIKDAPQYRYRGLLLDVARTFQPVEEIKRVLDYMALCKLNKLHLHLVDNPAWRVEIKRYPHFAECGGFRGGDSPLHPIYGRFFERYGGYYTQEQLRDIVAYASLRNIEVIPEIDMPGHSKALGVIHPDILCNYTPDTSRTNGIDTRNVWCVAKESNYALIEEIIKELVEIFPSEYIHIGGDEVSFSSWQRCPDCQALMRELALKDGAQLEQHFLTRVGEILARYNRKSMVWDEAVEGGLLPKSSMVTAWRGVEESKGATSQGYNTILMPSEFFYLDKRQSPRERGHLSSKSVSLKSICDFSLEGAGFTAAQCQHIAGIEAAFWSEIYLENIYDTARFSDYLEYMLFPRIFAVAEVAWSASRRSYEEMMSVVPHTFYPKLHALGATFRLPSPKVKVEQGLLHASTDDGSTIYYEDIRTGHINEYQEPLDADMAPFVTFQSRLLTGYSNEVGANPFYNSRRERVTLHSSMPFTKSRSAARCAAYECAAYTTRAAREGDWVEFRFEKPVKCSYLKVKTGYDHLRRCLIYNGHIEVKYQGKSLVQSYALHNGEYELRTKGRAIESLRIVADGVSDAESKVIIQPLIIK